MYKIIALIGEAGSGKDTLLKQVLTMYPQLHGIVSCTTRPPRENEIDGVDYFFLDPHKFAEKIIDSSMLEVSFFEDWVYGTSIDSLDENKINIGVFNPSGIEILKDYSTIDLIVFYVRAQPKTRIIRQLQRETNPDIDEIIRRYKTDNNDFLELDFEYIELSNEDENDLKLSAAIIGEKIQYFTNKSL